MKTVKLKQTSMGSYGLKQAGDIVEVSPSDAATLIKNGVAEETTDAEAKAADEKKQTEPEKKDNSFTITDNTGKEKKEIKKP